MNILAIMKENENHRRLFEEVAPSCSISFEPSKTVTMDQVQNADIIIGAPPPEWLKGSKKLRWLQLIYAGADRYAKKDVLPAGVILTTASGAYGLAISEYMLGVLLELFKNLHLYRDLQLERDWTRLGPAKPIYRSTALIIGAGDIGGEFAARLKALGAYTIGVRRTDAVKPDYLDELHFGDAIDGLLPRADIVAVSLPATQSTYRIISRERLTRMKRGAVLINVGRGSTVDTEALCDVLESGHLLGAALDVTDPEPLPKEHRLWKIRNAVITPHVSGIANQEETLERIIRIAANNLEAYIHGRKMTNVVDLSAGY